MNRPLRTGASHAAALLLLAALPAALAAQAVDRTRPPALRPAPSLHVPPLQTATLPNGLQLAVVEMHKVPVVDVTLVLDAGSVADPTDLPGLATFTANMLDEGAGRRSALEIAEEADFLGARLSTGASYDVATVGLHVPKRQLRPALDLMADVVLRPVFADSEITRQRDLRRTQILQQRDQPVAMAGLAFPAVVLGGQHPYGRALGGTEASTALLSRDRVSQFYRTYYRPGAAKLLVVGDITLAEAQQLVAERFGGWERGAAPPTAPAGTAATPTARTFYLVDKPGAAQSVIRIGNVGVARSTADYFPLQVLNTILGGSFTSRLNQNLRETHGYTYGANSQFAMRRMAGPFQAGASVQSAKTDSSLIEFMRELRRIRDEAVPQAELDKAKAYIALGLPGDFETTAGSANQFRALLEYGLPLDYYNSFVARINAVTAADVQRVARLYLDLDHFVIVVVGDRSQIEAGIRALHEGPISIRDLWGQEIH
jgi:predicted Zn-dependent peptidase